MIRSFDAGAVLDAMTVARTRGVRISFDCNFRSRLWGARAPEAPQLLRGLCERADLIFGDDRDFAFMLGLDTLPATTAERSRRAADAAFEAFSSLQYIASTDRTRHSADVQQLSAVVHSRHETFVSRAHPLLGIVDRIGAGDAFAAGVLHGLIRGFDLQRTVDFGAAAACLKHSIPGDFNLAGVADIELLLSEQRLDVRR
jgi:2-dehydro-3-deoxygluconokinase